MTAFVFRPPARRPAIVRCTALAVIVFLGTAAAPVLALDPERSLVQLHHTSWTAEDGAPSQVSAMAQTTDGYLWIGSARGLFRFDGVAFERYVPPGGVSLPSHNTYALAATPDGGLWISFRPSGLGFFKDGRLTAFVHPDEIPPSQVYAFACDLDGRVFAGAHDGLFVREGSSWLPVGSDWNLPPSRVQSLFVDRGGTLRVAAGGQIHLLARGSRSFVPEAQWEWVMKMSQGSDGRIWLAAVDLVTTIRPSRGERVPVIHQTTSEVSIDRDGCLWIATPTSGLLRVRSPNELAGDILTDDPRLESIREAQGLSANAVHVLFEDREGNMWAGTAGGVDRFRHNHLVPVEVPHGHHSLTLLPGEDGVVWVGNAKGMPLVRVSPRRVEVMDISMAVGSAYRGDDGVIWWGVTDRVVRQEQREFRSFPLFETPFTEWLWEIFPSSEEGALWVNVGDMGLYHFRDGVWEKRPQPVGLPDRGPSASYRAPDGSVWLGYTENRVCVLDGNNVRAYTQSDGIEIGRVRVIRGRGPNFWVGGELGLAFFDNGRFHSVACAGAEPFGTVAGIIETGDGNLWLNEMHGIVHIDADEVKALVRDPTHAVRFRRYDVLEGLPGAGQMNWNVSSATEASDGKLWFATDGGLAWIEPQRITTNPLPPPVVVRSITTEDGAFSPVDAVRLPNRTATLRIDYTALSLTIPERVQFRYRLEGYDEQWVDAGTRRAAFYTRLRPGPYRFQVAASNNDGVWNTAGAAATFSIAPAFYQATWFLVSGLLAVLCALWLGYRRRVRQVATRLQRLHDERMDERMRIAHELHDTLLQGFLSASMQLHVAKDGIPPDSSAKNQVGRVLNLMDEVIGDARNAVRGLRTATDAAPLELEHAFTRIPQEIGANGQCDFKVVINGRLLPLQPTCRDEVYRIGRESIVNAFRHAGARTIEAEITYSSRELCVIVRDDGRGIDAEVVRAGRDGHYGLSGMRERAKRMNGRLTVRSRPDAGTEIELVVPGRVVFVDAPPANTLVRAVRWLRGRAPAARKEE